MLILVILALRSFAQNHRNHINCLSWWLNVTWWWWLLNVNMISCLLFTVFWRSWQTTKYIRSRINAYYISQINCFFIITALNCLFYWLFNQIFTIIWQINAFIIFCSTFLMVLKSSFKIMRAFRLILLISPSL